MTSQTKSIISFSIDPALKKELQEFAVEDQRSLAQYIQIVLREHIAEKQKEK